MSKTSGEFTVWNSNRAKVGSCNLRLSPEQLTEDINTPIIDPQTRPDLQLISEIANQRLRWERVAAILDQMKLPEVEKALGIDQGSSNG